MRDSGWEKIMSAGGMGGGMRDGKKIMSRGVGLKHFILDGLRACITKNVI